MENKDWREEFDKKCKKFEFDGAYETDVDLKLVKPFIESLLQSKQEEIEGACCINCKEMLSLKNVYK